MNSQFQKPSTGSEGPSSAGDPPYSPAEFPFATDRPGAASPVGKQDVDGSRQGRSKIGSRSANSGTDKSKPTGSEALLEETQDAIGAATESVYAATDAAREASAQIGDVAKDAMRATIGAVSAQAAELTANI